MEERKDLFDFMVERVKEVSNASGLRTPQAFVKWFANMYFPRPQDYFVSDGSHDGKVDAFFKTTESQVVRFHVINSKFTELYDRAAPMQYYDEITRFGSLFLNPAGRDEYLAGAVKRELRTHYRQVFKAWDEERADLFFLTNHRLDAARTPEFPGMQILDLEHLIQHVVDDIDGAMPKTADLSLYGIGSVLNADAADTVVPTSIVFARLFDFIEYMEQDPYDLLFARNVRVPIPPRRSETNRSIQDTFKNRPLEFVYSNNGITILCESHVHEGATKELRLVNPRVVNGSQTLHSIRDISNPSKNARVMVRIVQIPPLQGGELPDQIRQRKQIIRNITVRSNQQNPMKKWNLVSNDDYQLGLYRFFRRHDYFYERRDREWADRSRELRSVDIEKGPNVRKMAQLIASFYSEEGTRAYSDRGILGPARAKLSVGKLFEDKPYEAIRKAGPELAFQLFVVNENIIEAYGPVAKRSKGLREVKGHANLARFALVTRAMRLEGAKWGQPSLTDHLLGQWSSWYGDSFNPWVTLVGEAARITLEGFKEERRRQGQELTMNNFFKTQSYVGKLMQRAQGREIRKLARRVLA